MPTRNTKIHKQLIIYIFCSFELIFLLPLDSGTQKTFIFPTKCFCKVDILFFAFSGRFVKKGVKNTDNYFGSFTHNKEIERKLLL